MNNIFPEGTINVTYKRGKSLRKLISPSVFPQTQVDSYSMVSKCISKRCAKTIWSVGMNLRAPLLAKHIVLFLF